MHGVSLLKSTGKLIEYSGQANLDTLKSNALGWGYKEDEIEVKFVTDAEWAEIWAKVPPPEPTQEQLIQAEMQRLLREQAIANLTAEGRL